MPQQIVLVRHGETEWSRTGRHTSHTDLALTEAGRESAAELAQVLSGFDFALVLCSPLRRARETCALAGYDSVAVVEERLREWEYGEYEGITTPQIRERRPGWVLWRDGCPGGEDAAAVGGRVDAVLERARRAEGDVLLFAHGHVLRVLTARWLGFGPEAGARFRLDAGAVSRLGYERETEVLLGWNQAP